MDKTLYEDIKYGTNIIPEDEYRETIMTIADVASEMVEKTLGPYGKTTMLNDGVFTYPTKDGWNVLKSLRFNDPIFNTLYGVLRQVSFDLVSKVGDGTTSAFIGATIFMHKILDYLNSNPDIRQAEFLSNLNYVADCVVESLKNGSYVKKIDNTGDYTDIYKIAEIASNGNEELAKMIQEIYQKTGNPNIFVSLDPSEKLSMEIQVGYKLECKPISQNLYINSDDKTYVESNPALTVIFDHNVNYQDHDKIISGISRYASAHRCSVTIFAPHFDDVMLNVIGTAMKSLAQRGEIPNILLVQVPLSMDIHREYLQDITLLTNSQIMDYGKVRAYNAMIYNNDHPDEKIEDALLDTDQYKFETPEALIAMCAGHTRRIVAGEKYILLQDYEEVINKQQYENAMIKVKEKYLELKEKAERSSTPLMKEYMDAHQHYTRLSGNMGVIKIGGVSELEKHCLKDTVDDAVLACRSAYENGYIRGLNLAMINTIEDEYQFSDHGRNYDDEQIAILKMLREVFVEMSIKVLENKNPGKDSTMPVIYPVEALNSGEIACRQTLTNADIIEIAAHEEYGFDLVTNTFMTDEECTVVNSVKTDIEVLRGMISILSTMLTSNQFLSINRAYDRTMGQKQRQETLVAAKVAEQKAIAEAVSDIVIKKLNDNPINVNVTNDDPYI
jgi:chaperonin GroEL